MAELRYVAMAGVADARPYGSVSNAGMVDGELAVTAIKPDGRGIPYVSDTPYVPTEVPYNERPLCGGVRSDGAPCKGKARSGGTHCNSHVSQE